LQTFITEAAATCYRNMSSSGHGTS